MRSLESQCECVTIKRDVIIVLGRDGECAFLKKNLMHTELLYQS